MMDTITFGFHVGVKIPVSKTTERFFMAEYAKFEPITGIDAEIEANNIIKDIKESHQLIGMLKSNESYDYMKLNVLERIKTGLRMVDKHEFQITALEGNEIVTEPIKIHLN